MTPPEVHSTRSSGGVSLWLGIVIGIVVLVAQALAAAPVIDVEPPTVAESRPDELSESQGTPNESVEPDDAPAPAALPIPPEGETPDPASLLVLVDDTRWFPEGWQPAELVDPGVASLAPSGDQRRLMHPTAAAALRQMFDAAAAEGITLRAVSGYRSAATQRDLFEGYVADDGYDAALRYSALPGRSEHQSGLAMDVAGPANECVIEVCFGDTPEGRWVAANSDRFGFIVRYPAGAESITSKTFEPWHLRYVGEDVAQQIAGATITFEEYLGVGSQTSSSQNGD